MDSNTIRCISHCLEITILFYGTLSLFNEITFSKYPTFLLFLFSLFSLIYWFRVPPPNENDVEKILGKDLLDVTSEEDDFIQCVAHRGASIDAPENTLAAYDYCKKKGCKAVELDVCLTADSVPIVFHDKSTGRMCNRDLEIRTTTYEELRKLNISENHRNIDQFPFTYIPTLDEAVEHLMKNKQKIFIDIKEKSPKLVTVILDLYNRRPQLYTESIITTFYPSMIYRIRRRNPRIVAALTWCPHSFYYSSKLATLEGHFWGKSLLHFYDFLLRWLLKRILYFFIGFSLLLLHRYSLDSEAIYEWNLRGVRVMAWTVNKTVEKKYCSEILKIPYLTDILDENSEKFLKLSPDDDYYNK